MNRDLVFEISQENGGFVAECLTEPIVTQGNTWHELRDSVAEAARGYYFDSTATPVRVRLHWVKDDFVVL
jgi:predicted RNase H-like HicB family nuclease